MALVSKKEFADMCGLPTKNLSTYIGRKKVKVKKKGNEEYIDTNDATNADFLEKRQSLIENGADGHLPKAVPVVKKVAAVPAGGVNAGNGGDVVNDEGLPPIGTSERKLRHFQAEKTELETKLTELKISKMQGEVVPTAPLIPIMKQHNKHLLDACNHTMEEMLTYLRHKYRVSAEDIAWMRGEGKSRINAALMRAIDNTEQSIDTIISDYAETRGKGERK